MAKNQNTFEKRRREMEKKRKAEEKREQRRRRKEQANAPVTPETPEASTVDPENDLPLA